MCSCSGEQSIGTFDTVNHSILMHQLSECYGIKGNAHAWLKSYLTERRQFITIKRKTSEEQANYCDVPQGSILSPNLYEYYTASSLGDIFHKHGMVCCFTSMQMTPKYTFLSLLGKRTFQSHSLSSVLGRFVSGWLQTSYS